MPATSEETEALNNTVALEQLKQDLSKRIVFGVLGSGCSKKLGYPLWRQLIELLEKRIIEKNPSIDLDIYKRLEDKDKDLLWYAGYLKSHLDKSEFNDFIKTVFAPKPEAIGAFHKHLIKIPFRHFLTLNYDTILEHTARQIGMSIESFSADQEEHVSSFFQKLNVDDGAPRIKSIFHLHGLFDNPEKIILTEHDYLNLYFKDNLTVKILWSIIASFRMLFVGFGMADLDVLQFFRKTRWDLGGKGHKHFSIMNEDDIHKRRYKRQYLREKYGIEPIFFSKTSGLNEYENEEQIIAGLANIGDSSLSADETMNSDLRNLDENTSL